MELAQMRISWLIGRKELCPSEKVLSVAMNKYADDEGYCWPSLRRMAKDSALSLRQVSRDIKSLNEKGYVLRFKRGLKKSGANFYRMLFPEELVRPNSPDRKLPVFYDPRGKTGDGQDVQSGMDKLSHGGGQTVIRGVDRMSNRTKRT